MIIKDFSFITDTVNSPINGNAVVNIDGVDYKAIVVTTPTSHTIPYLIVEVFAKDYPNKNNRKWFSVYQFCSNVSSLKDGFRKFKVKDEDNETYLVDESELVSMAFKDKKKYNPIDILEPDLLYKLNQPEINKVKNNYIVNPSE